MKIFVISGPCEKSLAHSDRKETEETIHVEVVCSFEAIATFNGENLLGQLRIFSVFYLPHAH